MPVYEYECTNCKFYSEVMQKISEPPLKKCPSCGKNTMRKLVSAPNFRLKGGGWYETDFKSDQENKRNLAADKEPEVKSAVESKPEAKPAETKPSEPKAVEPKPKPAARRMKKSKPRPKTAAKRRTRR